MCLIVFVSESKLPQVRLPSMSVFVSEKEQSKCFSLCDVEILVRHFANTHVAIIQHSIFNSIGRIEMHQLQM